MSRPFLRWVPEVFAKTRRNTPFFIMTDASRHVIPTSIKKKPVAPTVALSKRQANSISLGFFLNFLFLVVSVGISVAKYKLFLSRNEVL